MSKKIRSVYGQRERLAVSFTDETLTQQHFKKDCDINYILAKFNATGILETMGPGQYINLTESLDYREALHTIMEAQEAFNQIDAKARKEFDNDPSKFIEFLQIPENRKKAQELGFINPDPVPPGPVEVVVTNPPEPAA